MLFLCDCGRKYRSRVKCVCGQNAAICKYLGEKKGRASCGCGTIYQCSKLEKWCSPQRPREELFTITLNCDDGTSTQLSEETFQCCSGCNDFTRPDEPQGCRRP